MASSEYIERIEASADEIWALVNWLGAKKLALATTVESMDIDGDAVGAIRTVHFKDGTIVKSRLEELNESEKYYRYRMVDTGDFPFSEYVNEMSVIPRGSDACDLKCRVTLAPNEGVSAQECLDSWAAFIKKSNITLRELAGIK